MVLPPTEARGLVPVKKDVLKKEDVAVKREDVKAEDMEGKKEERRAKWPKMKSAMEAGTEKDVKRELTNGGEVKSGAVKREENRRMGVI
jgi:hypothetical protein